MLIINADWKGVAERLVDQAEVGVAAVGVPSGERWRCAQVFHAAAAVPAAAVRAAQPSDTHAIADTKSACVLSKGIHHTDHLVTRRDIGTRRQQITFSQVQISTADPATDDSDTNLPAAWCRQFPLDPAQWSAVYRSRLMHHPGVHLAILTTPRRYAEPRHGRCFSKSLCR